MSHAALYQRVLISCIFCNTPLLGTGRTTACRTCSAQFKCEACLDSKLTPPGYTCGTCGTEKLPTKESV